MSRWSTCTSLPASALTAAANFRGRTRWTATCGSRALTLGKGADEVIHLPFGFSKSGPNALVICSADRRVSSPFSSSRYWKSTAHLQTDFLTPLVEIFLILDRHWSASWTGELPVPLQSSVSYYWY